MWANEEWFQYQPTCVGIEHVSCSGLFLTSDLISMHCLRSARNIMRSHIDCDPPGMLAGAMHKHKSSLVTGCRLSLVLLMGLKWALPQKQTLYSSRNKITKNRRTFSANTFLEEKIVNVTSKQDMEYTN